MRFVPLKVDEENKPKTAKISVLVDDSMKGTPDNLRTLELPMISKLELEGETFVLNKIKLTNTIFHPKGWTKADSLIEPWKNEPLRRRRGPESAAAPSGSAVCGADSWE